jgi:hypothetical protein
MKPTRLMLAVAALAAFAAPPARAEMSGVPPEIQFRLVQLGTLQLGTPAMHLDASWVDRRFDWLGEVVQFVPSAMTGEHAEISGVAKEVQFWLLQPTVPAAEASVVRQPRTTTGQTPTTTGEGRGVPYPPPRPN